MSVKKNVYIYNSFSVVLFIEQLLFYYKIIMCSEASKVLLAETWTEDVDPTGWWMSEKLDGVRYENLL